MYFSISSCRLFILFFWDKSDSLTGLSDGAPLLLKMAESYEISLMVTLDSSSLTFLSRLWSSSKSFCWLEFKFLLSNYINSSISFESKRSYDFYLLLMIESFSFLSDSCYASWAIRNCSETLSNLYWSLLIAAALVSFRLPLSQSHGVVGTF